MQWYKIAISTTIHATDLLSVMLHDIGISGIEVINNLSITDEEKTAMYIDILPEIDESNESAQVVFYIEKDHNLQKTLEKVKEGIDSLRDFVDVGSGDINVTVTKDEDWAHNWKKFFKPFRVAEDIIIKPTWEALNNEQVKDDDLIVSIDPDMAFGTGSHETTRLSIHDLRKYLKPEQKVLDIGCGSGILSIIAKKLGAGQVTGIDIDGKAVNIARENAKVNNIFSDDLNFLFGNILNEQNRKELSGDIAGNYDIVVANILTEVIMELSEIVGKYLKPEGYFLSSGILY